MYFTGCESGSHEKRLLHALLDNYNVLERPVVNESDPLQLSFGLTLMQIIDVVSIKTFNLFSRLAYFATAQNQLAFKVGAFHFVSFRFNGDAIQSETKLSLLH